MYIFFLFYIAHPKKIIKYWLDCAVKNDSMKEAFIIVTRKQHNEDSSMYVFFLSRWLKGFKRDIWRKNRQTYVCMLAYVSVDSSKQWDTFFLIQRKPWNICSRKKFISLLAEQGMFQSIVAYILSTWREATERDMGREIERERCGVWG